jgi:hypothetical protein
MSARQERDQGQRRARSIRLALAGGGVVVTVAVAGVVQATSGVASTNTDQAPSGGQTDPGSDLGRLPFGSDPGPQPGFLAPGDPGGQLPHGSSHGS